MAQNPTSGQVYAYNGAQSTGRGVIYDALGNARVIGAQMPVGAAAGNVVTSDASGNLTLSAPAQLADYAPTGLTGATAASRYVGGTTSGAPVAGTFAVGDFIVDQRGAFWICTAAGSPGTWAQSDAEQFSDFTVDGTLFCHTIAAFTGNLAFQTAGFGITVKEGSNAKQGTATLSGGTVIVSNTSVTASSRIFLTAQDNSTTGALRVSARTASTSFTITSSGGTDSGVVAYEIFEPSS